MGLDPHATVRTVQVCNLTETGLASVFRYRRWLPVLCRQHIRNRCGDGGNRRRGILLRLHPGHQGLGYRGGFRRSWNQHSR